ncbi:hypothetical protein CONLIGDRAFT_219449 [Coniochaeta ligniaria NRRL 30616]|uniref:MARVEL domain-containing protein n=1 Tax=Coniochaeta ligniaria NRRL 30616 TaxID=1408157 RepID=A0A1J7I542_9PEZI|nr:hypothetical protein CONLIGDRAFT_219449 [Coniochaeta ligniaria NRRL 30616]
MSKHQVIGDSPFLKRVLIPFWVVRILVMVVDIAAYGLVIGTIAAYKDDLDDEFDGSQTTTTIIAILAVVMILILACLALDIVCIVKRARRTLSPKFFLIVNVVQTLLWTVMFILSMMGARSGLSIILGIVVYLSFLGLLIYASVVFHRHRKNALRGAYTPAINPALGDQQGLVYSSNPADYSASYPSYPSHAAYGEPPKQGQYEMDTQQQPQTYGYAPQTQGYPAQPQGYAPQQHGYPQYGNVS